jgi:heptaprenyl diphosphate synthase
MTSSAVDPVRLAAERRRIFLALFSALAIALHGLEFLLPSPVPWFRLGIANILALLALFLYDGKAAWSVNMVRIVVASLFLGTFLSPRFFLSLSGGVLATAFMTGSRKLAGDRLGPVGVSALGAAGHALGQLLCAWGLLVRHDGLWYLLPLLLLMSVGAGIVNGLATQFLLDILRRQPAFYNHKEQTVVNEPLSGH